jgi:predicted amidohydrolase YtcJ
LSSQLELPPLTGDFPLFGQTERERIRLIVVNDVVVYRDGGTLKQTLEEELPLFGTPTHPESTEDEEARAAQDSAMAGWTEVRARRDMRDQLEALRVEEEEEERQALEMEALLCGEDDDWLVVDRVAGG